MKRKNILTTWILIALAGLLIGMTGNSAISATPEIPAIDYLRFDYDHLGRFVVSWAGQFTPDEPGTFTLTGRPGPLVCRGVGGETDCDCRVEQYEDRFWIDCYFDSAMPFRALSRPCECLVGLWWENDAGYFHYLGNCTGRCLECVLLPIVAR